MTSMRASLLHALLLSLMLVDTNWGLPVHKRDSAQKIVNGSEQLLTTDGVRRVKRDFLDGSYLLDKSVPEQRSDSFRAAASSWTITMLVAIVFMFSAMLACAVTWMMCVWPTKRRLKLKREKRHRKHHVNVGEEGEPTTATESVMKPQYPKEGKGAEADQQPAAGTSSTQQDSGYVVIPQLTGMVSVVDNQPHAQQSPVPVDPKSDPTAKTDGSSLRSTMKSTRSAKPKSERRPPSRKGIDAGKDKRSAGKAKLRKPTTAVGRKNTKKSLKAGTARRLSRRSSTGSEGSDTVSGSGSTPSSGSSSSSASEAKGKRKK